MSSWWGVGEVLWQDVHAGFAPRWGVEVWHRAQLASVGAGICCPGVWHDQQAAPVVVLPEWQVSQRPFGT
jgi:hypothetical protein